MRPHRWLSLALITLSIALLVDFGGDLIYRDDQIPHLSSSTRAAHGAGRNLADNGERFACSLHRSPRSGEVTSCARA